MFGIVNYGVFLAASILLNLTPGADTMYILGSSVAGGRRAGVLSALGISTGCLCHTMLAALGLSIILAKSALAFNIVKYLGAGYLVYLGVRALLSKSTFAAEKAGARAKKPWRIYAQGILTNVLNPKVALFFLAFLPQYIDAKNAFGPLPFLLLGLSFVTTGTIWCMALALFSSYFSEKLLRKPKAANVLSKASGVIFIGLGLNLLRSKL